ncbi:PTS glucitol/sorbitol transporter subunit IIA [Humidisolicoccus flavus]|uniref:PTS glucitol/sorbitol transporter subunit IIA n=1 Tax=Humidisolicoccus flavus TaxID=3111414 RepID=UPI00324B1C74
MTTQFQSSVTRVGADAASMFEGGAVILFGEPCPDALAEVSVVHESPTLADGYSPAAGDVFRLGESSVAIFAVGELAGENLRQLGHVVIYCDPPEDQALLPGAILAHGTLEIPAVGDDVRFERGE